MKFDELKYFLENRMRLSHIYQPLLIKSLVDCGGVATVRQLATMLLSQDESQIIYYEKRLKEMPIKVLSKHQVISKEGELVALNVGRLTLEEKAEIKMICEAKMQQYITSKGLSIWDYRLLDYEPISDLLRYRVLSEAKGRCALCGTTKNEAVLDIDHIIPRSKGGKTVYENLQVLCAKCNRTKRNLDKTDFRNIVGDEIASDCHFCAVTQERIVVENELAAAIMDKYPVSPGHTLVIPKRHVADYFDTTRSEQNAINDLLRIRRRQLLESNSSISGFNVGMNCGETAGQTIFHCHVHLIPRCSGDTPNPRGGVRGVIPRKMSY